MTSPRIAPRVILLGGSSHAGKSTLAQALQARLGWELVSTDKLARHPGRPWATPPKTVPPHVAEHYGSLEPEALLADVLRHYRQNVWPQVVERINGAATDGGGLICEGSAIWPELVAALPPGQAMAVWLTLPREDFTRRIHHGSGYTTRTGSEQALIARFLQRTLLYDQRMRHDIQRMQLSVIGLHETPTVADSVDYCVRMLGISSHDR